MEPNQSWPRSRERQGNQWGSETGGSEGPEETRDDVSHNTFGRPSAAEAGELAQMSQAAQDRPHRGIEGPGAPGDARRSASSPAAATNNTPPSHGPSGHAGLLWGHSRTLLLELSQLNGNMAVTACPEGLEGRRKGPAFLDRQMRMGPDHFPAAACPLVTHDPVLPCEEDEAATCEPGTGPPRDTKSVSALILDWAASQTVKNSCLSHTQSVISLLEQPRTKTFVMRDAAFGGDLGEGYVRSLCILTTACELTMISKYKVKKVTLSAGKTKSGLLYICLCTDYSCGHTRNSPQDVPLGGGSSCSE
ncbi:uncharacterized protein [Callorhinus ursinus]|uniref:uncharacterized protein n=1 Tax=Callorhinus ursinus TaxID=34884 RepID=UPI003CD04FE8